MWGGKLAEKRKPENNHPSIEVELAGIHQALSDLNERMEEQSEHLVATRELSILQNETLPFINYQFQRQLFDKWALTQSLHEVEKEVSLRYGSFQYAMRDLARETEKSKYLLKYVDTVLRHVRTIRDENILLKGNTAKLTKQLQAKEQIIKATEGVTQEIRRLIEKRKLPPDVIAELKKYMLELPSPVTPTPPPGEEELG